MTEVTVIHGIDPIQWRYDWLVRGGYSKRAATKIASATEIDKDYAINLLQGVQSKGYDEKLAMDILF